MKDTEKLGRKESSPPMCQDWLLNQLNMITDGKKRKIVSSRRKSIHQYSKLSPTLSIHERLYLDSVDKRHRLDVLKNHIETLDQFRWE